MTRVFDSGNKAGRAAAAPIEDLQDQTPAQPVAVADLDKSAPVDKPEGKE